MQTLLDRCRQETARLKEELRRGIQFIESGSRLNVPPGEVELLAAKLSEHEALERQYAQSA